MDPVTIEDVDGDECTVKLDAQDVRLETMLDFLHFTPTQARALASALNAAADAVDAQT